MLSKVVSNSDRAEASSPERLPKSGRLTRIGAHGAIGAASGGYRVFKKAVLAGVMALALAACANRNSTSTVPDGSAGFTGLGANDLTARTNGPGGTYGLQNPTTGSIGPQIYPAPGRGMPGVAGAGASRDGSGELQVREDGDGFQLNFENAEVAAVAKTILGDILKANYTIDPRVAGTVSLNSARPVARDKLIRVLETTLKAVNVSIVSEGGIYRVAPSTEVMGAGNVDYASIGEGFGTSVIPVKYVSAAVVLRVLESFAGRPGMLRADPGTNLILVQGTSAERRTVVDAASLVDADWMRDQSVGIYPVANSAPETIIGELNRILETGENAISQGTVQLQPMNRLNAILVVSKRREVIDRVGTWVRRLDKADPMAVGVKVYRLKYARAKVVAGLLNDVFAGQGGGGAGQSDADALEKVGGGQAGSSMQSSAAGGGETGAGSNGGATQGASASPNSRVQQAFSTFGGGGTSTGTGSDAGMSDVGSTRGGGGGGGAGKLRISADAANNALLIYSTPQDYVLIERTIRQLDKPPVQVAIEATIAEVRLTDELNYGVQFFLKSNDIGLGSDRGSAGYVRGATAALNRSFPGFNLLLGAASDPRVVLNALNSLTNVKILSSPSLVVLDNQPAVLQVGDQVPVTTRSSTSDDTANSRTVNSVEYRDTGIILRVSPRVNANGVVTLDVEQEISNVTNADKTTLTPTISQRKVRSQIAVPSGQTVLLGGLISESQNNGKSGLPGVTQVKFLGDLLSSNSNKGERTELIIFIKPQIMRDAVDAQGVSEEFRSRMIQLRDPQAVLK